MGSGPPLLAGWLTLIDFRGRDRFPPKIMARTGRASSHSKEEATHYHREFAVQGFAVLVCTCVLQLPCFTGAAAAMIDTGAPGHCEAGGGNWDAGSGHCVCSPPTRCMGHTCARGIYVARTGWRPRVCPGCSCGVSPPPPPAPAIDSYKAVVKARMSQRSRLGYRYLPEDDSFPVPPLPRSEVEWPNSTAVVVTEGQNRQCTREMMTVVIPTYGPGIADPTLIWQYEILHPVVCELIVAWEKPTPSFDGLVAELRASLTGIRIPVRINLVRNHSAGSLNNRFGVGGMLRADAGNAILSMDDDILIRPQGIAVMLAAWKRTPDRIVGSTACGFASKAQKRAASLPSFAGNLPQSSAKPSHYSPVWPLERNTSCVFQLTNVAIVHKNYLGRYWAREPAMREARAYVTFQQNAEDLLMNFVVERHVRPSDDAAPPGHPRTLVGGPSIYVWNKMRGFGAQLRQAWFNLPDDIFSKGLARKATGISKKHASALPPGRLGHTEARTTAIATFSGLLGVDMHRTAGFSIAWNDECPGRTRPCNPNELLRGEPKMNYQTHEWKVWDMGTGPPREGSETNLTWSLPAGTPRMLYKTPASGTIPV